MNWTRPLPSRAVDDRAGGGEGAAAEFGGWAAAEQREGLSALGGEVKGGRRFWLTEAPDREDGIDDGGREGDRFGEGRSSFELNGGRVRRRIADDAARKGRGGSPTGNVGEAVWSARSR